MKNSESAMLPPEAIKEFKEIFKRVFGEDLSDEEASRRANNLIQLYQAVYGSAPTPPYENKPSKQEEKKKLTPEDEKKLEGLTEQFANLMLMQIDENIAKRARKKRGQK